MPRHPWIRSFIAEPSRGGWQVFLLGSKIESGFVAKWDNLKSVPTWGHTFTKHGSKVKDSQLIDRARSVGHQIGAWSDDVAAANFLASVATTLGPGAHKLPMPSGLRGRVFTGDGQAHVPDQVLIVVTEIGSVKTAYPQSSRIPTSAQGEP
jgi:hypothetical protein